MTYCNVELWGGGGIIFWWGCEAQSLNPYLKIFLPQKMDDSWWVFSKFFTNRTCEYPPVEFLSLCQRKLIADQTHYYSTRCQNSNIIIVPKFKSNPGIRMFHVRASHLWNNLPSNIHINFDAMFINQFKNSAFIQCSSLNCCCLLYMYKFVF